MIVQVKAVRSTSKTLAWAMELVILAIQRGFLFTGGMRGLKETLSSEILMRA
jgi:hypothetical protein